MPDDRKLFSKLFSYVLLLEREAMQGQSQRSHEQIRSEIGQLLEEQRAVASRRGMLEQEYQDACFAMIAWADETLLKNSRWEYNNRWKASPLQLEYYQTRNAGDELFDRLARLRSDQQTIREIYYLCLAMGFTGKYFLGLEDELKLTQIRREQAQHLPQPIETIREIHRITPQPYDVSPPKGEPIRSSSADLLLKVGVALAVAVPLVLLLAYWLTPRPSLTLSPPLPAPVLRAEDVQERLATQPCAKLTVSLKNGEVYLEGRVASASQRTEIRRIVENTEGVRGVNDNFQIIPRPYCTALELLEPLKKRAEEQAFGLAVTLNKSGSPPLYVRDENLIIEIKTPIMFDSHVYVDYYTSDGEVGHIFPNPRDTNNSFSKGRAYTVGQLGGSQGWQIAPPFGLELITVIASKTPLFASPRYKGESAESYLQELRKALLQDGAKPEVAATFHFLATRERD